MKRAQKIIIELRGIVDLTKTSEEDSTLLKDVKGALKTLVLIQPLSKKKN